MQYRLRCPVITVRVTYRASLLASWKNMAWFTPAASITTPQTQEKIECWHRSTKSQILLNNYYVSSELENNLQQFVRHYNHERYHHSLDNLTLAHVYYGRGEAILEQGEGIKLKTFAMRRRMHFDRQGRLGTQIR